MTTNPTPAWYTENGLTGKIKVHCYCDFDGCFKKQKSLRASQISGPVTIVVIKNKKHPVIKQYPNNNNQYFSHTHFTIFPLLKKHVTHAKTHVTPVKTWKIKYCALCTAKRIRFELVYFALILRENMLVRVTNT